MIFCFKKITFAVACVVYVKFSVGFTLMKTFGELNIVVFSCVGKIHEHFLLNGVPLDFGNWKTCFQLFVIGGCSYVSYFVLYQNFIMEDNAV